MAKKTCIFGGSFNPVHHGHLIMARDAMERWELDELVFVPCRVPPHKKAELLAEGRHRLAMLERVAENDPWFAVSSIELNRPAPSYSVDTVHSFRETRPDDELFFLIGSDSLLELHGWHRVHDLLGLCRVVTVARPGFDAACVEEAALRLDPPWAERLLGDVAQGHGVGIASSEIRGRVAEGMSIRYLVPDCVEMYICEHGLYRT